MDEFYTYPILRYVSEMTHEQMKGLYQAIKVDPNELGYYGTHMLDSKRANIRKVTRKIIDQKNVRVLTPGYYVEVLYSNGKTLVLIKLSQNDRLLQSLLGRYDNYKYFKYFNI